MKRDYLSFLFLFILCLATFSCKETYSEIMTRKVRETLGRDFKSYHAFSYPTNNYGLITAYTPHGDAENPDARDFLCDMWYCIGVEDERIPENSEKRLSMNGFAAVGVGGNITLNEEERKTLALKLLLPEIYQVVKLGAGFDQKKVISTELQIGRAYSRMLRRQRMMNYLSTLPGTDLRKKAFDQGDLLLIVADVVVEEIAVTVEVDASASQDLQAAIGGSLPKVGKVFKDSKLEVKLTSQRRGQYTFEVNKPVIVLRLAKRQPEGGRLAANLDNWDDWENVETGIPLPRFD